MRFNRRLPRQLNLFLGCFFVISFAAFLLLNWGAVAANLRYGLLLSFSGGQDLKNNDLLEVHGAGSASELVGGGATSSSATSTGSPGAGAAPRAGYRLVIPKISVDTPIVIPSGTSNKSVLASLEYGVGLYPNSAAIGASQGRSVILGHSSRAWWYRGKYAYVFSLLGRLEQFDEFYIVADGKKYVYKVFSKKVLSPSATNALLATSPSGSEVVLITCYPVGSSSSRTVIRANLLQIQDI